MNHEKARGRPKLSWEQIIYLLTSSSNQQYQQSKQQHHHSASNGSTNKLRIRILDTVFFQRESSLSSLSSATNESSNVESTDEKINSKAKLSTETSTITQWYFTSKKGELVRRKDPSALTLQHVYDRFCRFSLANISNASGPRIVSFAYLQRSSSTSSSKHNNVGLLKERVTFTDDQLKRETKRNHPDIYGSEYSYLQCYLRPFEGRDAFYRGVYRLLVHKSSSDTDVVKNEVLVQLVHDPVLEYDDPSVSTSDIRPTVEVLDDKKKSPLQQWIKKEIEVSILKIVNHLESAISILSHEGNAEGISSNKRYDYDWKDTKDANPKILTMTVDFVLDDNKQLWLGCIDDVTIGGEDNLIEQINILAKEKVEQNLLSGKEKMEPSIVLPPIEGEGTIKKNSEKGCTNSRKHYDSKPMNKAVGITAEDHSDKMQMKIANLKSQQLSMEMAEAESLVKIKNLRKEAHSKLLLEPLDHEQRSTNLKQGKKKEKDNCRVVGTKDDSSKTKFNINHNDEDEDIKLVQDDLTRAREDNEYLRQAMKERLGHTELIESLVQERDQLHKSLREEIIKHNNLRNKFDVTSRDFIELKARSKNEIESLRGNLNSEKDSNKKLTSQMRSTTQVLEAELKVQRDYVNELRAESWSELTTKLKKEVEASLSQELTKSTMSVSQAVGSTEERWKIRMKEMQGEHENEVEKMKQEFENDLRYQVSQNELKFNADKVSIEERLKKEHTYSLEAALRQEELLHRNILKNESKKWEQTMMDMKINLLAEQQQKHRRYLNERDEHWRAKITRMQDEEEKHTEEILETLKKEYESRLQAKESELVKTTEDLKLKEATVISALKEEAKKDKIEALQAKDVEIADRVKEDTLKVECRLKEEMEKCLEQKANLEKKTLSKLQTQLQFIKKDNDDAKVSVQDDLRSFQESLVNEMKSVISKIVQKSNKLIKKRKKEIVKQFEERIFENEWKHKEAVNAIQLKANESIDEQLRLAKEKESRRVEESLQSLAQDYEEQIQTLEYDLSWAKSQKATAEDHARELQSSLDSNMALLGETKDDMDSMRVKSNFEKLFMITKAMSLRKAVCDKEMEKNNELNNAKYKHKEIEQDLRKKIQVLEKQSLKYEQRLKLISTTLLNHRRDELLQHKTRSKEVALEMKALDDRIKAVEAERDGLLNLMSHLEDEMKDVERRINEHSQVSALQGSGKINIHHARKKRRLDEEYEQIITKIEAKRDGLSSFDEDLKVLNVKKVEFNDKMRGLERSLVELLVDQQKKLLSISSNNNDKNNKN